ncbi:MAG: prepilin-type N-terminal cleavage/methylation domain-containing protein [Armatimonadetes bacterium]|nr:prepilin-type N-terminal cleavage/methylation domain-containing protein [Armatimonadota bacterium]
MMRRAYTLVELLTVLAITAVLLTVLIVPLIQSFNATRQAQGIADSQEKARQLGERISSEIKQSVGVRDNSGLKGAITIVYPAAIGDQVPVTNPHPTATFDLSYAKLDIVKPAEGSPVLDGSGNPVLTDPTTGKVDPTLTAPKGQIVLPVAPGSTIIRYWIGLRDPLELKTGYREPYSGVLMAVDSTQDNLFVLYRAEVAPYLYNGVAKTYLPNTDLFQASGGQVTDLDDPTFFTMIPGTDYNPSTFALTPSGAAKQTRITNWLKKATIQTQAHRYDQVIARTRSVKTGPGTTKTILDGVVPLIQFKPERVASEPAEAQVAVRQGEETDNAQAVAADVFRTQFASWNDPVIRVFNSTWTDGLPYLVGRNDASSTFPGWSIVGVDPGTYSAGQSEFNSGVELFSIDAYQNGIAGTRNYPYSQALQAASGRSNWLADSTKRAKWGPLFRPLVPDYRNGKVTTSFKISEVGNTSSVSPVPDNQPFVFTGLSQSPLVDSGAGATYSPKDSGNPDYQINHCFNRVWNDPAYAFLKPDIHRFIDLRAVCQNDGTLLLTDGTANKYDGTPSPLDPLVGFPGSIAPGSEVVIGPDQNPGPNYGNPVRYTRVTTSPGVNQYKINYTDLPEPADYTALGFSSGPPATYTPGDFLSAVYQPRFKAGYIQLNSDPNVPLPQGAFQVSYRFQFNQAKDLIAVDYDTKQQLAVMITVRNYPGGVSMFASQAAQQVTVKVDATVRNFLR